MDRLASMSVLAVFCLTLSSTGATVEGSISETLRALPSDPPTEEFPFLEKMPIELEVITESFPAEEVDSATDWIYMATQTAPLSLPFRCQMSAYYSAAANMEWTFFVGDHVSQVLPVGIFDGQTWEIYHFPIAIHPSAITGFPGQGVFFGTTDGMRECCGVGDQGVCRLNEDGSIGRVFWPPLLRRWRERPEELNELRKWWEEPRDIWSLRFSSSSTLWVGMEHAVIRLDLDQDRWKVFDEYNSPIQGWVMHIASVKSQDIVRAVCIYPVGEDGPRRRIIRISEDQAEIEHLPGESWKARSYWDTIISDSSGTLWFTAAGAVWESDLRGTRRVMDLPRGDLFPYETKDLMRDSSGRLWVAHDRQIWVQSRHGWRDLSGDLFSAFPNVRITIHAIGEDMLGRIWVSWTQREVDGKYGPWPDGASVLGQRARGLLEESLGAVPEND